MEPIKSQATQVDKILDSDKPLDANDLYREFVGKTIIETNREENNVLRMLMHGVSKTEILKRLNEKHKKEDVVFNKGDLERFLSRNTQIITYFQDDKTKLVKRHLEARAGVEETMRDLLLFTQHHLNKANEEGDTRTVNDTVRTLLDVLKGYSRIRGWFDEAPKQAVQVNITEEVARRKSDLIRRVVEADFKVENERENIVSKDESPDK